MNKQLTTEQQFFLETLKRTTPLMSKEELGQYLVNIMTQNFFYLNALKKVKIK